VTAEGRQTPLYAVAIAVVCVGTFAFVAVLLYSGSRGENTGCKTNLKRQNQSTGG
jgi:hypothetical protein